MIKNYKTKLLLSGHSCQDCRWRSDYSDFGKLKKLVDYKCQRRYKKPRELADEQLCEYWTMKPSLGLMQFDLSSSKHRGWLPNPSPEIAESDAYRIVGELDGGLIIWPKN